MKVKSSPFKYPICKDFHFGYLLAEEHSESGLPLQAMEAVHVVAYTCVVDSVVEAKTNASHKHVIIVTYTVIR